MAQRKMDLAWARHRMMASRMALQLAAARFAEVIGERDEAPDEVARLEALALEFAERARACSRLERRPAAG